MEKFKEVRCKNNITQTELSELLGVSQQAISKYENGTREPDIDTLKKMSAIFDVSIDYLVNNTKFTNNSNFSNTDRVHYLPEETPLARYFFKDPNARRLVEIYSELSPDDQAILPGKALDLKRTAESVDVKKKEAN